MANVPTTSWDETAPAGNTNASLGDNRLREMKTQVREIINVDHDFPSSGQAADNGQHKQVTLQEQADLGTGAVGTTIFGSQTVSGKGEVVYTDEDDNDVQITSGGNIHAPSLAGVYPAANVAALATMMALIYPVGIVVTFGVSTNPNTLLGIGSWTAIEGKVIVGISDEGGDEAFDTLNKTGGAQTVTLSAAQSGVAAHTHDLGGSTGGGATRTVEISDNDNSKTSTTGAVTGGAAVAASAHTNLQPYIVKYVWQRAS